MQDTLRQELMEHWTDTLTCNLCKFPRQFTPQFRPIGDGYKIGGVAFVQINPGVMGTKTESQILSDYKEANQKKARLKNNATIGLQKIESEFLKSRSSETWNNLRSEYFKVMRDVWGWPPGRYAKTIENHGVRLENVAVVNLAQCPMEGNNYPKYLLDKCWENRTSRLINILQPKILVAQGETVHKYLRGKYPTDKYIKIVEGVHHASRSSNAKRNILFEKAKQLFAST